MHYIPKIDVRWGKMLSRDNKWSPNRAVRYDDVYRGTREKSLRYFPLFNRYFTLRLTCFTFTTHTWQLQKQTWRSVRQNKCPNSLRQNQSQKMWYFERKANLKWFEGVFSSIDMWSSFWTERAGPLSITLRCVWTCRAPSGSQREGRTSQHNATLCGAFHLQNRSL